MSRESLMRAPSASILTLALMLSACGGDGVASVASVPPPPAMPTPTPTPTPASGSLPWPLETINGYSLAGSLETKLSWLDTPATRNGSYDLIGRGTFTPAGGSPKTSRIIGPGEFDMQINTGDRADGDVETFTLTAPGILPAGLTSTPPEFIVGSWTINPTTAYFYNGLFGSTVSQALGQNLTAYDKAGSGAEKQLFSFDFTRATASWITPLGTDTKLRTRLDYDIGYSYAAMGAWSWGVIDLQGNATGESGDLVFVNGDRTPASGIPASGTATYDARSLWRVNVPFSLTADFGQRTMSASIQQDYRYDPAGDLMDNPLAYGIHVSGSAPFSNSGLFNIPLTGTVNWSDTYAINTPVAPLAEAASGMMNGAFFGPHAEQVGGTFSLDRANGTQLFQDAFVGRQHQP